MNESVSFQRLAAVVSIVAAILAFGSIGFQAVVLGVTTDPFSHPDSLLGAGAHGATLFRWGLILDIFGYYLFLRREQPVLGIFTIILGIFALLDALGRMLTIQSIFTAGLAGMLLLIPIWALWFGIDLLRSREMRIEQPVPSVSEK